MLVSAGEEQTRVDNWVAAQASTEQEAKQEQGALGLVLDILSLPAETEETTLDLSQRHSLRLTVSGSQQCREGPQPSTSHASLVQEEWMACHRSQY